MTNESTSPREPVKPAADATLPAGAGTSSTSPASTKLPRQITSANLLQGDREIQIVHGEEVYRLSLTRQGKLILHK